MLSKLANAFACGLCLVTAVALTACSQEQHHRPKPAKLVAKKDHKNDTRMSFRFIGPEHGNRIASIAGVPGNTTTYYAGASSGGLWKSSDGGNDWKPIFEKKGAAAIGAIAVAPSSANIVWLGTGEPWAIRDIDIGGNGVYKSTDGGTNWRHMGLTKTGRIARIIVDPQDPQTVFVCAEGRLTGPQQERGVFLTHDGGKTWTRSLFVDPNTGCSGLSMDAHDHNTLFAGAWQIVMHSWGEFSGGPGSGVYVTHDGGKSWNRITGHGLPHSPVGKIDVAVAPSDSNRVYALIETHDQGSFWRSDDGGQSWRTTSWDRTLIGRAGYYIRIAVSPSDENKIYLANSSFHVSTDGGETWPEKKWGGDNHDIWIDAKDASHFAITYDGGFSITTTGGKGFHKVYLPVGQMYHVAVDDQIPYYLYSNMQDDSTMRAPSIPIGGGAWGIGNQQGWDYKLGGCESGFTLPDITNPNIVWASCYADEVTRWDAKTHEARSVSPWFHTLDSMPNQTKYRCHWTSPLAIDPFDHNTVYYGCQVVFKTSNGGQSWSVISPDLSTHDPSRIVSSGGLIGDNLGQFYGEVVFALAPSAIKKGLLWAGTNDGKVWYTPDSGGHWVDVSASIGMKPWGTITSIQPSFFKPGTAYVSVDYHLEDDRDPYIYRTADFGKTWTRISTNLPRGELAYVRNVSEDPNCEGLLFAGTGEALYYSLDDGGHWAELDDELPHSPVTWTVVQKRFHDLVVSTWGRGLYVLDDITPLEQMAEHPTADDVRLFIPRQTYRLTRDPHAYLNFALKKAPKGKVEIQIADASGHVIRTMRQDGHPGLNRANWNMFYDELTPIVLRTIPPEDPHIWQESRFKGKDFRPVTHWGMPAVVHGPLAVPGKYQVRLIVDGKTETAPLEILRDPNSETDAAGMEATLKLQLRISDDIHKVADMVNLAEQMRASLEKLKSKYANDPQMKRAVAGLDGKIQGVEYQLFSRDLAPSDDKYYESAYKDYYNLLWLNAEIGTGAGDVAGGADFGPTDTEATLLSTIETQMAKDVGDYQTVMTNAVPAFNRMLQAKGEKPLDMNLRPLPDLEKAYPHVMTDAADSD
ncbi:MAG: sialidase [Alphaproteobacteria bacterium]|nr:sialidase [Alphaproteobacteria bacterium]